MEISLLKSTIPIVFLDTFALIDFQKSIIIDNYDRRVNSLYEFLLEKSQNNEVICPIGYQDIEINSDFIQTIKLFFPLSKNIRFSMGHIIEGIQREKAIELYLKLKKIYEISYVDAFDYDPITKIKEQKDQIISAVFNPNKQEIENRNKQKNKYNEELNKVDPVARDKSSFEAQVDEESKGIYYATKHILDISTMKYNKKLSLTFEEESQLDYLVKFPYEEWCRIVGRATSIGEYLEFLLSREFRASPYQDISTHLVSDIIMRNKKFKSGDRQDVINIATFLPYCNYFITDDEQKKRILKFGFDSKYNTKVFSMKNIEDFFSGYKKV